MLTTKEKFSLTPRTLDEAMAFAKIIAESDMVPACYKNKPGNVLVAVQMGQSVGLQPMQALQNIAVINGRPCIWGDSMLALVNASGELEDIQEVITESKAICTVKRKGRTALVREFTIDEANRAGLTSRPNSPWKTYPKRMLQMRARGFALRDGFPDILLGLNLAEEMKDLELTEETQKVSKLPSTSSAPVVSEQKISSLKKLKEKLVSDLKVELSENASSDKIADTFINYIQATSLEEMATRDEAIIVDVELSDEVKS